MTVEVNSMDKGRSSRQDNTSREPPYGARCWTCGAVSEPRDLGSTPAGWGRINDHAGYHYYLCPSCTSDTSSARTSAGTPSADCPISQSKDVT